MKIQFKILENDFTIESDTSEEHMQKVADYVGDKCKEIAGITKGSNNTTYTALLAALDIADELFQERELRGREKTAVENTIALLEKKLGSL